MSNKHKMFLLGIIVLAIFFRFYMIQTMPGGLFPDEAANGLDINSMQQGHLQPFYERGNGREALFFYMLWGSVELFGKGPWQHHIVSAAVGVLGVILCFLATRRLLLMSASSAVVPEKKLNELFSSNILPAAQMLHGGVEGPVYTESEVNRATVIALWASFLMAVSTWHVVLSRTAFRANLIPLFTTFTFYLLLCTYQSVSKRNRYLLAFLTGAAFALGFYTYIAYRILVPILGILVFWPFMVDVFKRPRFVNIKKFFKPTLVFLVGFIIFIYPIAKYFYTHPGSFVGRSGQVSVFNPELNGGNLIGAITEVSRLSIQAYFIHGDMNWRHNISGFPFLSQLVSPFFGIALVVITILACGYLIMPYKRQSWWKYCLLAGWFWGMLLPVVATAEGIPHGLRSIGTIPPVFIISALGLYYFGVGVKKLHNKIWDNYCGEENCGHDDHSWNFLKKGVVDFFLKFTVVLFVIALIVQTYFFYFVYAANSPENFYSFRSDLTPVSCYLTYYGDKSDTFLVLDKFSVQTPDYFTMVDGKNPSNPRNNPYIQVDPENSWELPKIKPGQQVVFTQSSIFDIKKFKNTHPETRLVQEVRNKFGQAVLAVYAVPNNPNGKYTRIPYNYQNSGLKIPSDCTRMYGPQVVIY